MRLVTLLLVALWSSALPSGGRMLLRPSLHWIENVDRLNEGKAVLPVITKDCKSRGLWFQWNSTGFGYGAGRDPDPPLLSGSELALGLKRFRVRQNPQLSFE